MPKYIVTSPDGKKFEVNAPDGATQEQVIAYAQSQFEGQKEKRPPLASFGRELGLHGRAVAGGLGDLAGIFTEPVRQFVTDPIIGALGVQRGESISDAAMKASDAAGLPSPETRGERIRSGITGLLAGSAGIGGIANVGAKAATGTAQGIFNAMAANQGAQAASALGAGAAGGYVREEGGGPFAQFGASLLGGLAAPLALGKAQGVARTASSAVQKIIKPRDIEGILKVELQKSNIDWNSISKEARAQLVKDAEKAVYSGQPIAQDALRRLADYRNIGATPLMGDITQDPRLVTLQQNLSKQLANVSTPLGKADLPSTVNSNAKRVISTLDDVADSPLDSYATGQGIISRVRGADEARKSVEGGLYAAARDSSGRAAPLNREAFVSGAFENLAKTNKHAFLPKEIRTVLNDISRGQKTMGGQTFEVPFTVDTIETYKTMLATASRGTKDGNVKAAIAQVRNALENAELQIQKSPTGSTFPAGPGQAGRDAAAGAAAGNSQQAYTRARQFAKSRRDWQESATFIEDALDGADADTFVRKHIVGAPAEELSKMSRELHLSADKPLRDGIRKQLVEHIANRGRMDSDTTKFSSAGMNDALKQIGDRKLAMFFNKEEISKIKSAVNVARYMQSQPIGSAVNNSNSAAMILGKLSDVLLRGSQRMPVLGPMVADPIRGMALNFQARQIMNPSNALLTQAPGQPIPPNALLLLAGAQAGNN